MRYFLALITFLFVTFTFAQNQPFTGTNNKKASKLFGEALQAFTMYDGKKASELLNKAIEIDPKFVDAYMLLADVKESNEQYNEAELLYEKAIVINPEFQIPYFKLATAQLSNGQYEKALGNLNLYKEKRGNSNRCQQG